MRYIAITLVCSGLLAAGGCGGGSDNYTAVDCFASSQARCDWFEKCQDPNAQGCMDHCECGPAIYRSDVIDTIAKCYESLACDKDDDVCETAGLKHVGMNASLDAVNSCIEAYHQSCPEYSDIDESVCWSVPMLVPEGKEQLLACFDGLTCGEDCAYEVLGWDPY